MAACARISFAAANICNCVLKRSISSTSSVFRLKSEWRVDRKPADTKLSDENVVERRKAYGGKEKWKAVTISEAKYTLESQKIENNHKILDVIHSDAGPKYRKEKVMAQGTYIVVDATSLKDRISAEQLIDGDPLSVPCSLAEHVNGMLSAGKLYARVTSRPGQTGNCDGVIVEGTELTYLIEKLKMYEENIS